MEHVVVCTGSEESSSSPVVRTGGGGAKGRGVGGGASRKRKYAPNEQGRYVCAQCSRSYAAYHVMPNHYSETVTFSYKTDGLIVSFSESYATHALRMRPSPSFPVPRLRPLFPTQRRPTPPRVTYPRHPRRCRCHITRRCCLIRCLCKRKRHRRYQRRSLDAYRKSLWFLKSG